MAATKTYGMCACGCDEPITHDGSMYAGADEAERNRHRARAAYKRRQGTDQRPAGTREALASLGLADDVTVADLAQRVAAATAELARRTAGLDSAAIQREIERGLAEARQAVEAAEAAQARATERLAAMAEELTAAVERADTADEDAAAAGERAEALGRQVQEMTGTLAKADRTLAEATHAREQAERKAERAEAVTAELRTDRDRMIAEVRRAADSETAVKLAELRAELTEQASTLRTQLATVTADRDGQRQRAERAEVALRGSAPKAPARARGRAKTGE
jgi:DNA repair exonuclease SbcCD ATPase subunit